MKRLFLSIIAILLLSFPVFSEDTQQAVSADIGISGSIDVQGQPSAGTNAGGTSDFPGLDQMPADNGSQPASGTTSDLPGIDSQAVTSTSSDFTGLDQISVDAGQNQPPAAQINNAAPAETAPAAPKKDVLNIKSGLPKYKAVPYTNELRIMNKETGELGQVDSLRRYMDWSVESSSVMKKKHSPENTKDLNAYTAWVEGKDGYGEGESLTLNLDPIYFAAIEEGEVDSVKCTGLKIINGYNKSKDDWFNNSRVKIMKIFHNNRPFCTIELYDSTNWQDIYFKKPMILKPGDTVRAKIVEVFEGYKYANAAITEFLLVGGPSKEVVGAQQMNGESMTNVRNGGLYFKK
jgi:hypothetical protein